MDTPNVLVSYDEAEVAAKITGGIPQIDGHDVREWSLQEVEDKLGPPQHRSQGREIGGRARSNLAYPQHRLLVQQDDGEIQFILFSSRRQ